jgi:MFS family permease
MPPDTAWFRAPSRKINGGAGIVHAVLGDLLKAMRTRLNQLPRRRAYIVLALTLAAIIALLMLAVGRAPVVPAEAATVVAPEGDLVSYQRIIERLRGGADYYTAAHEVLVADGYGTRSVFNWRTPAWPVLLAALPPGGGQGVLAALALAGLLLVYRMLREDGGVVVAALSMLAVGISLGGIVAPASVVFSEVAAGTLILISVAAYGNGWRIAGLLVGLLALFLRELAAPYVVVAIVLALRERRWREVRLWGLGLAAYAAYFGWHWWMVSQQLGPMDRAYGDGWLQFGGLGFILATAGFNGLWSLGPIWLPALLLPLGVLGLWAWPKGTLALATVVVFVVLFAAVGKPFNFYWGALYTPVLMLGMGWAVAAVWDMLRQR